MTLVRVFQRPARVGEHSRLVKTSSGRGFAADLHILLRLHRVFRATTGKLYLQREVCWEIAIWAAIDAAASAAGGGGWLPVPDGARVPFAEGGECLHRIRAGACGRAARY